MHSSIPHSHCMHTHQMRVRPSSTPQALHLRSAPFLSFSSPSSHEQQPQQEQVVRKQLLPDSAHTTVNRVVSMVVGTDGGALMSKRQRLMTDGLLDRLEEVGAKQEPRPLENELLWGNYNVVYTSTNRSQEKRSPSGGRFRSRIGRSLFQTTGLYQSVLKPGIVTNKVAFKLFGLIPGAVGLRGKVEPVGTNGDTVKVDFEPPVLSFAESINGGLHLRIGKESDVTLTTTYLDERVRVGKGSRGSLFVFTRGGAADKAGMDVVGRQSTAPATVFTLASTCIASLLGGLALFLSAMPLLQALSFPLMLLGAGLGFLLRKGSIIQAGQEAAVQKQELPAACQEAQQEEASPQQQQQQGGEQLLACKDQQQEQAAVAGGPQPSA
uniref:Plastid lipid-associated protein/fibrillin conserved domain-containing protein n=2 Tax=Dunaliella tertiolecta TaxID=3047 RepID=A0A7S3VJL2_DUNTE|mmetsp:Transcript_3512/g.9431  ORF Transcript_3512/g.9431 Transcript_3512/m.9431 type:complete len:381 (+) Transcript_3512:128-1270(+)